MCRAGSPPGWTSTSASESSGVVTCQVNRLPANSSRTTVCWGIAVVFMTPILRAAAPDVKQRSGRDSRLSGVSVLERRADERARCAGLLRGWPGDRDGGRLDAADGPAAHARIRGSELCGGARRAGADGEAGGHHAEELVEARDVRADADVGVAAVGGK